MAIQVPASAADLSWLSTTAWSKTYCALYIQFQDPWFQHKEHTNGSFVSWLLYQIPLYHTCHMPIPLITPLISGEQYSYDAHKLNTSLHPLASSFHLAPDIPLSILSSNTFSLHLLFTAWDHAMLFICLSHPEYRNMHVNNILTLLLKL
jgi:hypothetical protein